MCSCLLFLIGLAGAHGMLSTLMSQPRVLRKALKGNIEMIGLSPVALFYLKLTCGNID